MKKYAEKNKIMLSAGLNRAMIVASQQVQALKFIDSEKYVISPTGFL